MKLEKTKNNIRNSNIELTRIIAMFFIVAGHFVDQGGNINYSFCLNDYLLVFFSSGSRIAVNIFLLIGIWFMVDAKFTVDRIFKLYLQLVTYCIPITIVMILINHENITVKSIICGLLPFSFRALWFASAYITLIIFKPFLDKVLSWNKKQLCLLVVLLLSFVSLMSTISRDSQGYVLDSLWFLVVYLFVGTAKKYDFISKISKKTPVIVCVLGYLVLTIFLFLDKCYISNNSIVIFLMKLSKFFRGNIRTIPNFTIALSIVVIILNFKEKSNKIINKLSKCTLDSKFLYVFMERNL